ncbi:MAG TPA: dihydropteroate synthase [Candidatus Cryptobacteroides excrementigallinarum]|nr:dihydropteroate synthase [Candidatus Cryptobacteroides excrementigallinarum]
MAAIMGIINLTPDSFFPDSRCSVQDAAARIARMLDDGADIIDIGAVSTRPGAGDVGTEEEWRRLSPVLPMLEGVRFSVDTTSAEIVRRVFREAGPFIVNDISAGEDDSEMLPAVAGLGLEYVAMHKRGNPRTMDSLCSYPRGVVAELAGYFQNFADRAEALGIRNWVLDPGFGFAKTEEQNLELLERLGEFKAFGRPILVGIADKRFTHGETEKYHRIALRNGADILRVHDVAAAKKLAVMG